MTRGHVLVDDVDMPEGRDGYNSQKERERKATQDRALRRRWVRLPQLTERAFGKEYRSGIESCRDSPFGAAALQRHVSRKRKVEALPAVQRDCPAPAFPVNWSFGTPCDPRQCRFRLEWAATRV